MKENSPEAVVVLHENENYIVQVSDDKTGYVLTNKHTDVVETVEKMLPHAISLAEQNNAYLVCRTWQWIGKQEENNNTIAADQVGFTDLDLN